MLLRRSVRHGIALLTAIAGLPLLLVALLRPGWRVGLAERLGSVEQLEPGSIWIHGASVGEALAALPLIERLRASGCRVFVSLATRSGREVMRRAMPDLPCALAPLDHPWSVRRALARVRPEILVLVETELWPCWIAAARRGGVPVVVVSGRLSDRSFPRYQRLRWLLGPTLARLDAVGARTQVDAERFIALGVDSERVSVTGDLKLDPGDGVAHLATDLVRALSEVMVFVAGSTHEGEERTALRVLEHCEAEGFPVGLVLAPRHPERADAVEREVAETGRRLQRRSTLAGDVLATGDVLLLDSIGELAALYATAAVSFVGGSLVPVGGHNVLEPVFAGCPVLYGPHFENVRASVELLEESGAGRCVADEKELARAVEEALADPERRRTRGAEGRAALELHRGSAERTMALIASRLPPEASRWAPATLSSSRDGGD
ncbi:MAG: glycosyltransferase [Deltaproteobacteria bacterium]|nr:glycosyltransferase [Deltaproteobacteria bacterium]MBW2417256.1 glycosyltransferase [Deltaproteobacteria bacterium]